MTPWEVLVLHPFFPFFFFLFLFSFSSGRQDSSGGVQPIPPVRNSIPPADLFILILVAQNVGGPPSPGAEVGPGRGLKRQVLALEIWRNGLRQLRTAWGPQRASRAYAAGREATYGWEVMPVRSFNGKRAAPSGSHK